MYIYYIYIFDRNIEIKNESTENNNITKFRLKTKNEIRLKNKVEENEMKRNGANQRERELNDIEDLLWQLRESLVKLNL